jgi:hypothetical protein
MTPHASLPSSPEATMTASSLPLPSVTLSLVPLDGDTSPTTGRAVFHPNTRDPGDRRRIGDRRALLRMQKQRRSATDRRPRRTWENGHNL